MDNIIKSKADYHFFLEADRIALSRDKRKRPRFLVGDETWKFQRLLRKLEYYQNCKTDFLSKIYWYYLMYKWRRASITLGFWIPPNVFGPGLSIAHPGSIIVNDQVKVGENCRISQNVVIGTSPSPDIPFVATIGNNVFIGPGVVIMGKIEIADGIAIGANSYVDRSFTERDITIAGNPARKISEKGQKEAFGRATDVLRQRISASRFESELKKSRFFKQCIGSVP
jgi:serine O-acetyltransferase